MSHSDRGATGRHEGGEPRRGTTTRIAPRVVLWTTGGLAVLLCFVGTLLTIGTTRTLALVTGLGFLGAAVHLTRSGYLPTLLHPVRTITVWIAVLGLLSCLLALPGGAVLLTLGALLVTTAAALCLIRRHALVTRRRMDLQMPSGSGPDDVLRREWLGSMARLRATAAPSDRLTIVRARQGILDDILDRSGGLVPGYVWASVESIDDRSSHRNG